MRTIPHERSLVKKFENEPFALLGVNSDKDKALYFERAAKMGVTWRSFWCGERGGAGPIPSQWRIHTWPTLYLIDQDGVIRQRWMGTHSDDNLDGAIEALIEEMERGK